MYVTNGFFLLSIVLFVQIGECTKCLYRFSDPSGEIDSIHLSRVTDKHVTIIGEHTYKYPEVIVDECTSITNETIGSDGLWLSVFPEDKMEGGCCTSQQLECQKYRKSHETIDSFVKRVRNSCKTFIGVIRNVYCVSDKTTGQSYVQRITLSDHSFTTYLYGCGLVYTVQTPWGETISLKNKLYIDVEKNIVRSTSEISITLVLSFGVILSICMAIPLALTKGVEMLSKSYPNNIIVKILMVIFFPFQLIITILVKYILPNLSLGSFGTILNFIGIAETKNKNSTKRNVPTIIRHLASATGSVSMIDITGGENTSRNSAQSPPESNTESNSSAGIASAEPYNSTTMPEIKID